MDKHPAKGFSFQIAGVRATDIPSSRHTPHDVVVVFIAFVNQSDLEPPHSIIPSKQSAQLLQRAELRLAGERKE